LGDSLKGLLPVLVFRHFWGMNEWTLAVALAAVIGHNFPIYIRFKGGKGVATSFGVLLGLWPWVGAMTLIFWIFTAMISRYSSLAALVSFGALPFITALFVTEFKVQAVAFALVIAGLLFYRHTENILRLLRGEEKRFGILLLCAFLWLSVAPPVLAGSTGPGDSLPPEVEKIWRSGASDVDMGNLSGVTEMVNRMNQWRGQAGPVVLPDIAVLLVRKGDVALGMERTDIALLLAKTAQEFYPSYAPAYHLQAKALLQVSYLKLPEAVLLFTRGVVASFHDFWTTYYFLGKLFLILLLATGLTCLSYGALLIVRFSPYYFHLFKEWTGNLSPSAQTGLWTVLVLLTLVFHPGWAVVVWTALAWVYLKRMERVLSALAIGVLMFFPLLASYGVSFYLAEESSPLTSMVALKEGMLPQKDTLADDGRPEPRIALDTGLSADERQGLMEAMIHERRLQRDEAIAGYQKVLLMNPASLPALIHLGNLYFQMEKWDEAADFYTKALAQHPGSAASAFNLAQTYKEKLLFEEGEKTLNEALKIDKDQVEEWIDLSKRGRGFAVVDEGITTKEIWKTAATLARRDDLKEGLSQALFGMSKTELPFAGGVLFAGFMLLSLVRGVTPMAYTCPQCERIVCGRCGGSRYFGKTCLECRSRKKAGILETERPGNLWTSYLWGFFLPGSIQVIRGAPWIGSLRTLLFFMALAGLFLQGLISFPVAQASGYPWDRVFWFALLIGVYYSVLSEFKILKIKFRK
jgi:acyl-phosphate glycerol 3-phosphate acyltransferase